MATTQTTRIVYAGQRQDVNDKPFELFYRLQDDDQFDERLTFVPSKRIKGYAIGHVYSIEHDDNGYQFGSTEWQGEYSDKAQTREWQAEHTAARVAQQAKATERKHATNDSALLDSLAELREAYKALHPTQRLAFEVWVLSKLRSA